MSHIITSGDHYIDIDAFACIYAYLELLKIKGYDAKAIITVPLNASITNNYKKLDFYSKDTHEIQGTYDESYYIMDVSDPKNFEKFVNIDHVYRIFDHHSGFERFWREKIGTDAIIKPIGAAATLIYQEFLKENLLQKISNVSAELLAVAIISNTLNFQAKITNDEDKQAYEKLKNYFNYNENFEIDYFLEVQNNITKDIRKSLKDDSKHINDNLFIAQLEVWDANNLINNFENEIMEFLGSNNETITFLNIIEIGKGRNIIIFRDKESFNHLKKFYPGFKYDENKFHAITDHVILRKEILSKIHNY